MKPFDSRQYGLWDPGLCALKGPSLDALELCASPHDPGTMPTWSPYPLPDQPQVQKTHISLLKWPQLSSRVSFLGPSSREHWCYVGVAKGQLLVGGPLRACDWHGPAGKHEASWFRAEPGRLTSFLLLLLKMITNVSSYISGGQKSETGLSELQSRRQQGYTPFLRL